VFQAVPAKPANFRAAERSIHPTAGLTEGLSIFRLAVMDFSAHSIIWVLVAGLIIGAIAKLLMPGRDPGGCIITMLLGVAGAFVGTWLGRMFTGNENYVAHWIMSIVGAMLLLFIYRMIAGRRS
jgi:uncharacterized membrane protein YeaQ/YmgE (transglycosylase-associated protein family)